MLAQLWERGWEILLKTPPLKRWVVRQWYEFFATVDRDGVVPFMNYGYAEDPPLSLETDDEVNRFPIQMYHHVAAQMCLGELDVLEVGSGRGGGASYLMRYIHPRTYTGIDIAGRNVAFCQKRYRIPGLSFFQGDAEALDFPNATFDAVVNIESSSHYGHIEKFLREVKRVLRPGGYLLYADIWQPQELRILEGQFERAGLDLVCAEDMAPNVLRALDADDAHRQELITRYTPKFLHGAFMEFAGTRGSEKHEMFHSGKVVYLCCLLQNGQPNPVAIVPAEMTVMERDPVLA